MEKVTASHEYLLHGGSLNMDNLIQRYFPEDSIAIHDFLTESILNRAKFRLFGGTLINNLSPDLQILDLRNAASYFSKPNSSPVIGRSKTLIRDHPGDLINCLEAGLYDYNELRHIASQVRDDLDMSVEGIPLEQLFNCSQSFGLHSILSSSISTPDLTLLKLSNGRSQMTIMEHGNKASFRTPPAMNLDTASAEISIHKAGLIASLSDETIKLIGIPPHQRIVGWKQLQRDPKRRDLILSRGLRHVFTLNYKGFSVDTPGNIEESALIRKWLNNIVRRMKMGDPSLALHRKEIGVAIIGRFLKDPGLQFAMSLL